MGKLFCIVIGFTFLCSFGVIKLNGQNYSELYGYLDESQVKMLDKLIGDISNAGSLMQQANAFYTEASALQADYDLSEKKLQNRLSTTEQKAVSAHLKADKLYSKAYSGIYSLCLKSFGESDETTSGRIYKDEGAALMEEAAAKRKEAGSVRNPYQKAELLNDAESREAAAVDNMIMALQVNHGIEPETQPQEEIYTAYTPPAEDDLPLNSSPQTTSNAGTIMQDDDELAMNMDVINSYNNYVSDRTIPDPLKVDREGVTGIDANMDTISDYLNRYATYPDFSLENETGSTDSSHVPVQTSSGEMLVSSEAETKKKLKTSFFGSESNIPVQYSKQSDVRFMVQIAASRAPLTRSQLWAIYPGNFTVEVMHEGNWYKYRITGFRLFTDAAYVARQTSVSAAWVLAAHDGTLMPVADARELTKDQESDIMRYGRETIPDQLDYYVQMAASKIRIEGKRREDLCQGFSCREVIEGGWFKYQISAGSEYNTALDLKNKLEGKSFIVAYRRGTKVNLYKTLK
jgi:hypothetical protein